MRASSASSGWGSCGGIVMALRRCYPYCRQPRERFQKNCEKGVRSLFASKRDLTPFSFGVGLVLGAGALEGGVLEAGGVDGGDAGVGGHRDLEAVGVRDLGDE